MLPRKAALIVLDDIWDAKELEAFRADASRSQLLFTTRDASIAVTAGAREHTADLLTHQQSRELLARWSERSPDELPGVADELIRECGRLPLAVSMTGAMLRGKPIAFWKGVLGLLQNADLQGIRAQFSNYPHPNLFRTIDVSVDQLEKKHRVRYVALAVLLEDMAIDVSILCAVWGVDEFEALQTTEELVGRSLALRAGEPGAIRLHDLQFDYVRAHWRDHESLTLILDALRLSAHVILRDQSQFSSQMTGRLLLYADRPAIGEFLNCLRRGAPRPWLRPLFPALAPPGGALRRTLAGHTGVISGLAIIADGKSAVSCSWDGSVRVWDLETSRELHRMRGSSFDSIAVSPDGHRAATHELGKLRLWSLESGMELRAWSTKQVHSMSFTADGRRFAFSTDYQVTMVDLDGEEDRRVLSINAPSSRMSADGRRAISYFNEANLAINQLRHGKSSKPLKVWDLDRGVELRELDGHDGAIQNVQLSPDGRWAVSGSKDQPLKVWDLDSGRQKCTLGRRDERGYHIAVSADGRRALSVCDRTVEVWDLQSGAQVRTLEGHPESVGPVALSPDGRIVISASGTSLKVWDLQRTQEAGTWSRHTGSVNSVAVSADAGRAVTGSADRTVRVWDVAAGRQLQILTGHQHWINHVAITADGTMAASTSWDETLKIWNLEAGVVHRTIEPKAGVVRGVAMSRDGAIAVSGTDSGSLHVWDLQANGCMGVPFKQGGGVRAIALSVDGKRAYSTSYQIVKIWEVETGRELRTLNDRSHIISGIAVAPDERRAVSSSWQHKLMLWDLETGKILHWLTGHSNQVNGVALSGDGMWIVSAADDRTVKVWDAETSEAIAEFTCEAQATCCAFAGSRTIVAGDESGQVYFLALER